MSQYASSVVCVESGHVLLYRIRLVKEGVRPGWRILAGQKDKDISVSTPIQMTSNYDIPVTIGYIIVTKM